jgi:hypothetical protein
MIVFENEDPFESWVSLAADPGVSRTQIAVRIVVRKGRLVSR